MGVESLVSMIGKATWRRGKLSRMLKPKKDPLTWRLERKLQTENSTCKDSEKLKK